MKLRSSISLRPKRLPLDGSAESGLSNRSPGGVCTPSAANDGAGVAINVSSAPSPRVSIGSSSISSSGSPSLLVPPATPLPSRSRTLWWPVLILLVLSAFSILAFASIFNYSRLLRSSADLPSSMSVLDPGASSTRDSTNNKLPKGFFKVSMAHRESQHHVYKEMDKNDRVHHAVVRDVSRVRHIRGRIIRDDTTSISLLPSSDIVFESTVESGVSLGSGEYFMDVYIGTPPKHFSLIIDTGSDLNWVQCLPCDRCYQQDGPYFDPDQSSSYSPIACSDHRCGLIYTTDMTPCTSPPRPCHYFYNYGDSSNTTGDLATETFTLSLGSNSFGAKGVMFGCGHNNQGLFRGAGGLIGLGKGPLSFVSQLRSLYGNKFSYCLVDRNNNLSVSSVLVFGEDKQLMSHKDLQYCDFVKNKVSGGTFYYMEIESIKVGGQSLSIPAETWKIQTDGTGGTIIDSGTTLTYFTKPAYEAVRQAFKAQIKYPQVESSILELCYDLSQLQEEEKWPGMSIVLKGGAEWKLPTENYMIELYPEKRITCLAILGTPISSISILGNLFQQNFHILYDLGQSRLGFAPMPCHKL